MTNPSAQTMLERAYELVDGLLGKIDRQTGDQKPDGDMPDDAEYHVMLRARDERNLNEAALLLKSLLDQADKSARAASAPEAVREALAIAKKALEEISDAHGKHYNGKFPRDVAWTALDHVEKALTTPEEASTTVGETKP